MNFKSIMFITTTFVLSNSVNAALVYTDKASFEAAVTIGQTIDFEAGFISGENSITFGDATFVSTDGTGLHRTIGFGASTVRLAAQNSGGIRIDLAPGWTAIGMDVGELFSGVSYGTFTLRDAGNNIIDTHTMEVGYFGPSPSFFGLINNADIVSLQFDIFNGSNEFETIDNVMLANATSAVPVPAAVWLFGSGLIGLAGVAGRKKYNN